MQVATKNLQVTTYMAIGKATIKESIGNQWLRYYNDSIVRVGQNALRNVRVYFEIDNELLDYSTADLTLSFKYVEMYSGAKMKLSVVNEPYNSKPDFVHPSITTITDLPLVVSSEPQTITVKNVPTSRYGYCLSFVDVNLSGIWHSEANMLGTYATVIYNEPKLRNVAINGGNIESLTTVTWETDYQDSAVVNVKNSSGTILATKSVLGEKACTFNVGEIKQGGSLTFEVTAYYKRAVETSSVAKTLIKTVPVIVALEPNNVNQDKDTDITVAWNSSNQQAFSLIANGKIYTGTTAKSIVIPKGTFPKLEIVNLSLAVSYAYQWGEIATVTKSASFLLVGKPNAPTLEQKQYYTEANPTFNWTGTDAYVQYRCEVYKALVSVFDSGDTVSSETFCKCTTTLENNTQYTVKVKVKTQFGYWSDYATNTFMTNFEVANKPSIQLFNSGNGVLINSNTTYSTNFTSCELYRRTDNTDWIRIAYGFGNVFSYVDNFVGNETYYYKATSLSMSGGKNDSDIVSSSISISNFNFLDIEDVNNNVELAGSPNIIITQNMQVSTNLYSGCVAPVVDQGIQNYKSGTANFMVRKATYEKLLSVINKAKVLLYRDRRGEKFYCAVTSSITKKYEKGDLYNISFSFVEVPCMEKDMYRADGVPQNIIFFDGTYAFDGAITFSGEV